MRLTGQMVEELSTAIAEALTSKGVMELRCPPEELRSGIVEVIIADLKVEDQLNDEVKRLLEAHPKELKGVDYQKMFKLIKERLIKERGLII